MYCVDWRWCCVYCPRSSGQLPVGVSDADPWRDGRAARLAFQQASERHTDGSERWGTGRRGVETSRDSPHWPKLRPGRPRVARVRRQFDRLSSAVRRTTLHPAGRAQHRRQIHPQRHRNLRRHHRRLIPRTTSGHVTLSDVTLRSTGLRRARLSTDKFVVVCACLPLWRIFGVRVVKKIPRALSYFFSGCVR